MVTRRLLLTGTAFSAAVWCVTPAHATEAFAVIHSKAEWRALLTPEQYIVLRESDTERAYTSPLLHEDRPGIFACAGCDLDQFSSTAKYETHTGWPSFLAPLDGAVETTRDTSFATLRRSLHCTRCGSHVGHVFNDGPKPAGLRYCMNGVALTFKAAAS